MSNRELVITSSFKMILVLQVVIGLLMVSSAGANQEYAMPDQIDPKAHYFFFLHNYYVEKNGPDGQCKYGEILNTFAAKGFFVVSELRSGKIVPCEYSTKIVSQVKKLLAAGVPPGNIVVSGHSKGGAIALCVSSQLNNPDVRFVIMAGCEIAGIKKYKMYPDFVTMKGKVLSIYADTDTVAGSCKSSLNQSDAELQAEETVITSALGHRLFFAPDDIWVTPVSDWLGGTKSDG